MWGRRPLVPMAAGLTAGIWGADRFGEVLIIFLMLLAIFSLMQVCQEKQSDGKAIQTSFPEGTGFMKCFLLFILLVAVGTLVSLWDEGKIRHVPAYEGEIVMARGLVAGVKSTESYIRLKMDIEELNGEPVKEKTLITIRNYSPELSQENLMGREIQIEGRAELPGQRRNPKTFDYKSYLETQRIFGLIQDGRVVSLSSLPKGIFGTLMHHSSGWKERIGQEMSRRMPADRASMLMGMMFGETGNMDERVLDLFRKNGTAHILAVSGLHVAMVYASVSLVIPGVKIWKDLVLLVLLVLYMIMADFSPSVTRAFLMILIHIAGKRLYARYDLLSSGSLALVFLLLINPRSLFNPGFQLSFLAIFSLAFLLPILEKLFNSRMIPMLLALPMGLSPFTAYLFNYVSLAGLVLNPPVIFLAGVLIPASLILLPLVLLPGTGVLLDFMGYFLYLLLETLYWMNNAFFTPGRSFVNVMSPGPFFLFLYYTLLILGTSEGGRWFFRKAGKKWTGGILLSFVMMLLVCSVLPKNPFQAADVIFVDVGQGDCIHLRTEGGKHILVDGGGQKDRDVGMDVLLPYLLKNRVPGVDLAVVTHLHTDHFDGIASLAREGMVKKLVLYEGYRSKEEEILSFTGMKRENLIYVHSGMVLRPDSGSSLHILGPPARSREEYERNLRDSEDENKNSLVVMAEIRDGKILLTGDITREGEEKLMDYNRNIQAEVLKVSHHGSKSSTGEGFLNRVSPGSAVIQVGRNYYGHPSREVLDRLEARDIPVFRTDHHGAIALRFGPSSGSGIPVSVRYTVLHPSPL